MKTIECPYCNTAFEYLDVEGSRFGDRLLEDVWFRISLDDDNQICVVVDPSDESYFMQFNANFWYSFIKEVIEGGDELACPKCDEEFSINPDGTTSKVVWLPIHSVDSVQDLIGEYTKIPNPNEMRRQLDGEEPVFLEDEEEEPEDRS